MSELDRLIEKQTGRKKKVLVLYGYIIEPGTRACRLTLEALGLKYKFYKIDPQVTLSEEFLKKNPFPREPLLEDDDELICEGHAIVMYLVQKYAKNDDLYPKDLYQRALVNRILHFDSGILNVRHLESFARLSVDGINEELIADVYDAYRILENFLSVNTYLAGNKMTIADICVLATISSMQVRQFSSVDTNKYPKLAKWIETMSQLPYYRDANYEGSFDRIAVITHILFALYLKMPLPEIPKLD